MAVKFLRAMGCDTYVISTSPSKEALAKQLGAHQFVVVTDEEAKKAHANKLDFIIDTGT
jgi:alcohol dehydrogenase (NADP+)